MSGALVFDNVSRFYGDVLGVNRVTLSIPPGITSLVGPNGSGKTTTIRMLCGLLPPTSGSATVAGADILRDPETVRRRIGYMSQKFSLYADLSVRENLEFYGRIYGLDPIRLAERSRAVQELTGITDRLDQLAGTLSGGWKQRLALACALIHEPDVVFLDEPTAGLDPIGAAHYDELVRGLQKSLGLTILMVTHDLDSLYAVCDRIAVLLDKRVVVGTMEEMLAYDHPWVREYFHGPRGRAAAPASASA